MNVRETEYALRRAIRQCQRTTGRESYMWWSERRLRLIVEVSAWRRLTADEQQTLAWGLQYLMQEADHAHAI